MATCVLCWTCGNPNTLYKNLTKNGRFPALTPVPQRPPLVKDYLNQSKRELVRVENETFIDRGKGTMADEVIRSNVVRRKWYRERVWAFMEWEYRGVSQDTCSLSYIVCCHSTRSKHKVSSDLLQGVAVVVCWNKGAPRWGYSWRISASYCLETIQKEPIW